MANDQFLDSLQIQESKVNMMWNLMSNEQRLEYKEQQKTSNLPKVGRLIDIGGQLSPVSSIEVSNGVAMVTVAMKIAMYIMNYHAFFTATGHKPMQP